MELLERLRNIVFIKKTNHSCCEKLLEKIENDDDVQNVFHNMNG